MRRTAWIGIVALLGAAPAQERRPAFLRVVDATQQPVGGAKVTCFASPGFAEVDGASEVVEVVADERGRALPRLQAGRFYSVFASAPAGDGACHVSEMLENVTGGGDLTVRLVHTRRPLRLHVEGTEAWLALGPLSFVVFPSARNALPMAVLDGIVPPMPALGRLQVLDATGQTLWTTGEIAEREAAPGTVTAVLPPPQDLRVRTLDANGKPLANIELFAAMATSGDRRLLWVNEPLVRPAWRSLGRTGADGTAKVPFAVAVSGGKVTENVMLEARDEGRAIGKAGVRADGSPFSGGAEMTPADGVLPITLGAMEPLRVHPPAQYTMTLVGRTSFAQMPLASREGPVRITTDAAGKAHVPLPRDIHASRIARVERAGEAVGWANVEPEPQGSFVFAVFRSLRLQVLDAAGGPARGQHVVLSCWKSNVLWPGIDLPMPLDAAGRTQLRIGRGLWFLWCCDGANADWGVVDDGAADLDLVLTLRPIPCVAVRVLDGDGVPRANGIVHCAPWLDWNMDHEPASRHLLLRQQQLCRANTGHCTTDPEGRLRFPLLPLPNAALRLQMELGPTTSFPTRPRARVTAGECVDVELR